MADSVSTSSTAPRRAASLNDAASLAAFRSMTLMLAVLSVLALLLLAPVAKLGLWMMSRDYYQHVPWMVLFAIGLGVYRYRNRQDVIRLDFVASPRVLFWTLVTAAMVVSAYVLPSRWIAGPALVCWTIAALTYVGGWPLLRSLAGPVIVLISCIPLPVLLDNWFVLRMQQLATWVASLWLDLFGVLHLATGVDIRTTNDNFVVADACSGIHSMFAAIAIGVGYGAIRDYRFRRILGLVLQIVFWVVIANAVRVFALVYVQSRYDIDLSTGWRHDLLGMVTFGVGVLLATSSDHLWRYLIPRSAMTATAAKPGKSSPGDAAPRFWDAPVTKRTLIVTASVLGIFATASVLGFSQFGRLSYQKMSTEELVKRSAIDFDRIDASHLPEELAGWKQVGFLVNENTSQTVFGGMKSFIWQYSNGKRTVLISLDGPYSDWHDLAICYSGVGWTVAKREPPKMPGNEQFIAADLSLERPPLDRAEVLFACVDPQGECVPPPPHFGDAMVHFVNRLRWGSGEKDDYGGGVVQLQLLDETPVRLSEAQLEQNRALFAAALEHAFRKEGL